MRVTFVVLLEKSNTACFAVINTFVSVTVQCWNDFIPLYIFQPSVRQHLLSVEVSSDSCLDRSGTSFSGRKDLAA